MFEKKSFKVLATSPSLEIVLPFSINTILSLDLIFPEKNGLTVGQKFMLLVISFSLRFANYCLFWVFFLNVIHINYVVLCQYTCLNP